MDPECKVGDEIQGVGDPRLIDIIVLCGSLAYSCQRSCQLLLTSISATNNIALIEFKDFKVSWILYCFILILLIAYFPPNTNFLKTSKITPFFISILVFLTRYSPAELQESFHEKQKNLMDLWKRNIILMDIAMKIKV